MLDRDGWSSQMCDTCGKRQAQLVIDARPENPHGGLYSRHCWQCYWFPSIWKKGPIVNCGPLWDGVDVRRESANNVVSFDTKRDGQEPAF